MRNQDELQIELISTDKFGPHACIIYALILIGNLR